MILVTGASGMVGGYFEPLVELFPSPLELTNRTELDVQDWGAVHHRIRSGKYSHVIHLAAETDVDKCQREPEHAYKSNADATHNIAAACAESGSVMVYISTGGVFGADGTAGPYDEECTPAPCNIYGKSKLAGEMAVRAHVSRHFIARAGWIMGGGPGDHKFVAKIVAQIKSGSPTIAVTDRRGSPTYAMDFVEGLAKLMQSQRYGTYHLANEGDCSRYEIALQVAKYFRREDAVNPADSSRFPLSAPRSLSEALDCAVLRRTGLFTMRHWNEALLDYLSTSWPEK